MPQSVSNPGTCIKVRRYSSHGLSDRIYVIYEGRINGEFKRNSMDDKSLGLLMLGGKIENE